MRYTAAKTIPSKSWINSQVVYYISQNPNLQVPAHFIYAADELENYSVTVEPKVEMRKVSWIGKFISIKNSTDLVHHHIWALFTN